MELKPLYDKFIVEPLEMSSAPNTTESGIILNVSNDNNFRTGVVKAIGTGIMTKDGVLIPLSVKEGDKVLYHKAAPMILEYLNKEIFILREQDVICLITK